MLEFVKRESWRSKKSSVEVMDLIRDTSAYEIASLHDIVRCRLTVDSMIQFGQVLMIVENCDASSIVSNTMGIKEKIELVTCVNALEGKAGRVIDAGSVVIHFRFVGGDSGDGHICELQLCYGPLALA
jgi:hypothetical protein